MKPKLKLISLGFPVYTYYNFAVGTLKPLIMQIYEGSPLNFISTILIIYNYLMFVSRLWVKVNSSAVYKPVRGYFAAAMYFLFCFVFCCLNAVKCNLV